MDLLDRDRTAGADRVAHGEFRGDPNAFTPVLTFAPDGAATRIEMRTVFPTVELRHEKRDPGERPGGTTFHIRLFDGVDAARVAPEQVRAEPTQRVTHLTYAVRER